MEKSILDIFYKIALFVATFLLTNLAIGSDQLISYISFCKKEYLHIYRKTRQVLRLIHPFGR